MLSTAQLYTFVDFAYLNGRSPDTICQQLCDGGSDIIQLRAKNLPAEKLLPIAASLRTITRNANVALVINDHPRIAATVGADYCHLGQEDFFNAGFTAAAQIPCAPTQIGLSTHAPEQAQRALAAHPAYIAIGPIYATPTKPTAPPVTLDYVRWAAKNVSIPWFAIGGINLHNLGDVLAAGATRICVVSAILNSTDIVKACREFKNRVSGQS